MKKHSRATSLLFAVATGGPASAIAEPVSVAPTPEPAVQPRVLANGSPACGNVVVGKGPMRTDCTPIHQTTKVILTAVISEAREIGRMFSAFDGFGDRPLMVSEVRRPRSR